jgi:uncharacterized SAM-binding protein YcdF (DUF218 family)
MFLLKKFIATMLFPAALSAELIVLGLVLMLAMRRRMLGRFCIGAGVALFLALSQNAVGDALLRPLESEFAALHDPLAAKTGRRRPRWVVVLGGGHRTDSFIPLTSRLTPSSLGRLIEGIRLHRLLPDAKLLLSGGGPLGGSIEAEELRRVALSLGMEGRKIAIEDQSRNTRDQAVLIRKIVGKDGFILVTSASHMPRAVMMFQKEGMDPLPAPVDHLVSKSPLPVLMRFVPSSIALMKSRRAFYEYLALTFAKLRGHIE